MTQEGPNGRETVTIKQAGEIVGVSRRTINNWIKSSKIEYTYTAGGGVRIFKDTLWRNRDAERFQG